MQIRLGVVREIEIDDDVDRQDVNTSRKNVCADETASLPILEIMINPVPILLLHF